jgi:SAM-dependent methyltransferase
MRPGLKRWLKGVWGKKDSGGLRRTSEHWAEELQRRLDVQAPIVQWFHLDAVQARMNFKVTGDPNRDPYQHFLDVLKARGRRLPVERSLTLGSGSGVLERGLCKYDFCRRHDGYDISEANVRHARHEAEKAGLNHLHYEVADINSLGLPPNTYDTAWFTMAAHHIEALEHVFGQLRRALKPNGMVFLNEYVGPNRFQWTSRQLEAINKLLKILPESYRRRPDGSIKTEETRPLIREVLGLDPSEAVRSADVLPALEREFRIVERKDYGGTVLHMLLHQIAFHFQSNDSQTRMYLRKLFQAEDKLIASGELPSDFTVVIAEPR